jgi:hypothetical protein
MRRALLLFKAILNPILFTKIEIFLSLGYWPNLKKPRSFNEKIFHRMLFNQHPLSGIVVDKYAVREYVCTKTNRPSILNQVLFVGSDPRKIPFQELPNKFVIKATHGSGWNIIVTDKNTINYQKVIARCNKWLRLKYSTASRNFSEKQYDNIKPQIMIEKFIDDSLYGIPLDYKFLCFNGQVKLIQVNTDRFLNHKENYYDVDWNAMDFKWGNN